MLTIKTIPINLKPMTTTPKKLSEIENPSVGDSANPVFIKLSNDTKAKLIGYSPANTFAPFPVFHVLPEGNRPGYEVMVKDAEIILN